MDETVTSFGVLPPSIQTERVDVSRTKLLCTCENGGIQFFRTSSCSRRCKPATAVPIELETAETAFQEQPVHLKCRSWGFQVVLCYCCQWFLQAF